MDEDFEGNLHRLTVNQHALALVAQRAEKAVLQPQSPVQRWAELVAVGSLSPVVRWVKVWDPQLPSAAAVVAMLALSLS